ncbi:unnamed protein product [Caretta caretta]
MHTQGHTRRDTHTCRDPICPHRDTDTRRDTHTRRDPICPSSDTHRQDMNIAQWPGFLRQLAWFVAWTSWPGLQDLPSPHALWSPLGTWLLVRDELGSRQERSTRARACLPGHC